jgi:hypothetical protein
MAAKMKYCAIALTLLLMGCHKQPLKINVPLIDNPSVGLIQEPSAAIPPIEVLKQSSFEENATVCLQHTTRLPKSCSAPLPEAAWNIYDGTLVNVKVKWLMCSYICARGERSQFQHGPWYLDNIGYGWE